MATDPFTRTTTDVDRALVMACSRRTAAANELRNADTEVERCEHALLGAEQARLMRERHVDLCDRQITGLLDERLRSTHPDTVADMVNTG